MLTAIVTSGRIPHQKSAGLPNRIRLLPLVRRQKNLDAEDAPAGFFQAAFSRKSRNRPGKENPQGHK